MKEKSDKTLNIKLFNEKTKFEKFTDKLKYTIFNVIDLLLEEDDGDISVEFILNFFELLQVLNYTLKDDFLNVFKNYTVFPTIANILNYLQLITLFKGNTEMFLVCFYVAIVCVALVVINIAYVSISISRNKLGAMWPLRILRSVVGFIVTILFMPIVGTHNQ
jgi:hypothetical protein